MFPEGSGIDAQVTFVFPQGIAFLNTRSGHFYQPITLLRLGSILKLSTGLKRAVISCSFHLHLTSQNTLASRYRNIRRNGKLLLYILYIWVRRYYIVVSRCEIWIPIFKFEFTFDHLCPRFYIGVLVHINPTYIHTMLEVCETTIGRLRIDPTRLRTDGWRNDSLAKRPTFYSFDQAAPPCQKALDESGYHYTLQYEPAKTSKRKNRQRNNILWYNPPFSKNRTQIPRPSRQALSQRSQVKKNLQPKHYQDHKTHPNLLAKILYS